MKLRHLVLLGILLLALGLRVLLLPYGLPLLLYEDEPIYLYRALEMGFGNFDPQYFKKPSFFLYSYFGVYWLAAHIKALLLGQGLPTWKTVLAGYWQDPTFFTVVGRSITLAFSGLSIWLTYRVGRLAFSPVVGICAAAILALDYTHLPISGRVISDIPALCFVLLTAWFSLRIVQKGRLKDYIWAGVSVGLAMSYKYNGFVVLFLLAAHIVRTWDVEHARGLWAKLLILPRAFLTSKALWLGLSLSGLTFVLLNPYVLINASQFLADIQHERDHIITREMANPTMTYIPFITFDNIFFQILPKALGWPLYVFGLLGMAWFIRYPRFNHIWGQHARVLLCFMLGFLLVMCQLRLVTAKYLLPILPFWGIFASVFLVIMIQQCLPVRYRLYFLVLGLTGLLFPMGSKTMDHLQQWTQPDTRTEALTWLTNDSKPNQTAYADPEALPFFQLKSWSAPQVVVKNTNHTWQLKSLYPDPAMAAHDFSRASRSVSPHYIVLQLKPQKNAAGDKSVITPTTEILTTHRYTLAHAINPYQAKKETYLPCRWKNANEQLTAYYERLRKNSGDRKQPGPILLIFKRPL